MDLLDARSARRWLASLVGAAVFLTAIVTAALGQSPADERLDQIERRIRRQRAENLQAVHAVIDRLSQQLAEQRALLAKDQARLRSLGDPTLEPDQELLALEAQLEDRRSGPPRPSPATVKKAPAPEPEVAKLVPMLPAGVDPFVAGIDEDSSPARKADVERLHGQIKKRRAAIRGTIEDLLRARSLLQILGDDSVSPPAVPGPPTNAGSAGGKRIG